MKRLAIFTLACIVTSSAYAAPPWKQLMARPDAWFKSPEGETIVANVLANQAQNGAWPKNGDTTIAPKPGAKPESGTFDNGATVNEVRFLARVFAATKDARCKAAVDRALNQILAAQYPTGGWPQYYPPGKQYHRHITLNDNTMVNLMELLRDVSHAPQFDFINSSIKARSAAAFDRGIECLVKSQIRVNGELTVWCAQHDEVTLEPRPARSFELVSLSGAESAAVLLLLMSLENPSPEVKQAIRAGTAWFEKAKITGIRQEIREGDKVIVADASAPPLWARFYEIGTNRPIFSGRDSVLKYSINEIEPERRNGYAWYGAWGEKVAKSFASWSKAHSNGSSRLGHDNR